MDIKNELRTLMVKAIAGEGSSPKKVARLIFRELAMLVSGAYGNPGDIYDRDTTDAQLSIWSQELFEESLTVEVGELTKEQEKMISDFIESSLNDEEPIALGEERYVSVIDKYVSMKHYADIQKRYLQLIPKMGEDEASVQALIDVAPPSANKDALVFMMKLVMDNKYQFLCDGDILIGEKGGVKVYIKPNHRIIVAVDGEEVTSFAPGYAINNMKDVLIELEAL